jgi:hypothetical protein
MNEKKGEIFNQLAIISDLLENINLAFESANIVITLKEEEFNGMFDKIVKKTKTLTPDMLQNTFTMKIGSIDVVFTLAKD